MAGAAPGTPYHRLARTARYRWWAPPLALLCAAVLFFVFQVLVVNVAGLAALLAGFSLGGDGIFGAEIPDFAVNLVLVSMLIPAALLAARFVQRRRMGGLFSVEGRLRGRWLVVCLGAAVIGVAVSFAFLYALNRVFSPQEAFVGAFGGADTFAVALVVIALFMPFQAAAEEIALRGFLMQAVGSYGAGRGEPHGNGSVQRLLRSPLPAIAVSGGVFALLHSYGALGKADVAVFGLAIAWLTWYTGGIEAAIALHVLHNALGMGLSAYQGTLADAGQGSGNGAGIAKTLVEVGVYAAIVVFLARRRGLRRRVPAPDGAAEPRAQVPDDPRPPSAPEARPAPPGAQWAQPQPPHPPAEPPPGHGA